MSRKSRNVQAGYAYHITTRCNNREFKLQRWECREVFLYAIKQALDKYKFKLYGLCIMSNHIHYLIEPTQTDDLPKIMHFLNYGSYDQLTNDGLTQWHPAFLQLGNSLEDCARKYRGFCQRYNPKSKPARKSNWGNKLLAGLDLKGGKGSKEDGRSQQHRTNKVEVSPPHPTPSSSPSSSSPPRCQVSESPQVRAVATQFIRANQAPRRE